MRRRRILCLGPRGCACRVTQAATTLPASAPSSNPTPSQAPTPGRTQASAQAASQVRGGTARGRQASGRQSSMARLASCRSARAGHAGPCPLSVHHTLHASRSPLAAGWQTPPPASFLRWTRAFCSVACLASSTSPSCLRTVPRGPLLAPKRLQLSWRLRNSLARWPLVAAAATRPGTAWLPATPLAQASERAAAAAEPRGSEPRAGGAAAARPEAAPQRAPAPGAA